MASPSIPASEARIDWECRDLAEIYNDWPRTHSSGAVFNVAVFDASAPNAPEEYSPFDAADCFVHLLRQGFRSDADLHVALQQFAKIEGETWAVILRDAMTEQLVLEQRDRGEDQ